MLSQGFGLCSEALVGAYTEYRVLRLPCLPAKDVPHRPFAAALVVGVQAVFPQEVRDGGGAAAAQLRLEQALVHWNQHVAPLPIEAEGRPAFGLGHGKDRLVSRPVGLFASQDLCGLYALLSDMAQRVVDPAQLEAQLVLITDVPQVAASALTEMRAVRLNAGGESSSGFSALAKTAAFVTFTMRISQRSPGIVLGTNTARPLTRHTPKPSADQPSISTCSISFFLISSMPCILS